MRFDTITFH